MKKEMLRRRYSRKTIKTYITCMKQFLKWCKHKEPRKFTKYDIKDFLTLKSEEKVSSSTLNVYLNSIKFAFCEILGKRNFFVKIPCAKVGKKLPEVLTKQEVLELFNSISNKTHKLMVKLMYSAGLRVGELVCLKVRDFEFSKNYGWVRSGKGNKDRMFLVADSLKEEIKEHIKSKELRENNWLFKGRNGTHLSISSIQQIVKKASKNSKIDKKKNILPHTLRHSFATHLIENGYDVTTVQSLLGHNSAETTMVYVHIACPKFTNVKSPLDSPI